MWNRTQEICVSFKRTIGKLCHLKHELRRAELGHALDSCREGQNECIGD